MRTRTASRTATALLAAIALAACVAFGYASPSQAYAATLVAGSQASSADNAASISTQATKTKKAKKVYKIKTAAQFRKIGTYNGGTFKIMRNIKLPSEKYYLNITKNKKYTIDLNGKKVSTAYKGVALRTVSPIYIQKGTVVLKSSKKNKGVLYSTETAAITVMGTGKLYLKSGSVVNDAVEFRSDITSAVFLFGKAKCYLQGKMRIRSIGNGIALFDSSRLYATGNPYVRAGANEYKGMFTHYGSGISVASRNARISLKGGSYGTKASPDAQLSSPVGTFTYAMSANYPILDQYGKALKTAKGYKYVDARGKKVAIRGANLDDYYDGVNRPSWSALLESLGYSTEKRLTTTVKSADGYYTIYVRKK